MSQKNYPPIAKRRGLMFVLSSPSGAGKTTLSRRLLKEEEGVDLSVSVTTRPMRPGEVDGRDYHFITPETYDTMVQNDDLLEHATVFDYQYGTPKAQVLQALEHGHDVLFDIDWQGTRQLAEQCREDLVSVFLLPPTLGELERRLRTRAQDSEAVVQKRMAKAVEEISHWEEYDYVVINEDLDHTMDHIRRILHAERFKRWRQRDIVGFVQNLCKSA